MIQDGGGIIYARGRQNRLCMAAPAYDSSLDRDTVLYTIALREQWSGNSLKLLSSFCEVSVKLLSSFSKASLKLL